MANKYSAEQVIQAIKDSQGIVSYVAKRLGCTRKTVYNYIDNYVTVKEALVEARENQIDYVEGKLLQQIETGNITAIIFYLKTQGKERGYSERHEVTGKDGGAIATTNTNVNIAAESPHDAGNILAQLAELGAIPSGGSESGNDSGTE